MLSAASHRAVAVTPAGAPGVRRALPRAIEKILDAGVTDAVTIEVDALRDPVRVVVDAGRHAGDAGHQVELQETAAVDDSGTSKRTGMREWIPG